VTEKEMTQFKWTHKAYSQKCKPLKIWYKWLSDNILPWQITDNKLIKVSVQNEHTSSISSKVSNCKN